MAEIELASGLTALVDDADLPIVAGYPWGLHRGYARAHVPGSGKASTTGREVLMHRLIVSAPAGVQVDHVNHNGLDNRRCNLRLCSASENRRNMLPRRGTSRFKGVSWSSDKQRWRACIELGGRTRFLGYYDDEHMAAEAYDRAAAEAFGEFAWLNFAG